MIKSSISINNKLGLHARASAKLSKLAGSFRSDIHISRNGRRVNAKSIMGVMMPMVPTSSRPSRPCAASSRPSSAKANKAAALAERRMAARCATLAA